jgi:protocatechuate 3,4-dioxygenase alpha subunit
MAELTPFQTIGPFFHIAFDRTGETTLASGDVPGVRVRVEGTVRDGAGDPVADALVELWQADSQGVYIHEGDTAPADPRGSFHGFARVGTDDRGRFAFETVKPGPVPDAAGDDRRQAPHVLVSIFARGILSRLVTRMYFDDEPANADDAILGLVPPHRRRSLIAGKASDGTYRFDIVLQGEHETVFFDV